MVDVPFGTRKQLQTGVVWTIGAPFRPENGEKNKFKQVAAVSKIRPPLEAYEMALAEYMHNVYFCSLGACVRRMILLMHQKEDR